MECITSKLASICRDTTHTAGDTIYTNYTTDTSGDTIYNTDTTDTTDSANNTTNTTGDATDCLEEIQIAPHADEIQTAGIVITRDTSLLQCSNYSVHLKLIFQDIFTENIIHFTTLCHPKVENENEHDKQVESNSVDIVETIIPHDILISQSSQVT